MSSGPTSGIINDATALYTDAGSVDSIFGRTGAVVADTSDYAAFYVPYTGAANDVDLGTFTMRAAIFKAFDGSSGLTTTITTAALTTLGTQGTMVFKSGLLVSSTPAT